MKKTFLVHSLVLAFILTAMIPTSNIFAAKLSSQTVNIGREMRWYPSSDSKGFPMKGGTKVTIKFSFKNPAPSTVTFGLKRYSDSKNYKWGACNDSNKIEKTKTTSTNWGKENCKVYLSNSSSDPVKVISPSEVKY